VNFGGDLDHRLDTEIVFQIRHYWEIRNVVKGHSLWPPYGIGQAIIFFALVSFFFLFSSFSSPNLSGRRLDVFRTWCGLSANLECRSEMCCMWLAGNAGREKSPKIRRLGTIALSGYIFATTEHIDNQKST